MNWLNSTNAKEISTSSRCRSGGSTTSSSRPGGVDDINNLDNKNITLSNINQSVFKDILFWGMFFIGFIVVGCFYSCFIDFLSPQQSLQGFGPEGIFNFIIIYKVFIGFIFGYFISIFRYKYFCVYKLRNSQDNGKFNIFVNKNGINIFIIIIFVLLLSIFALNYGCFDLINTLYCEGDDDIIVSESTKGNLNNNNDDNNYHFTISKSFVKEGFDSIFKALSDSLPELISGFGGAKIGTAVVKGAGNLPPLQRGLLGALTGGAGALAIGLGGTVVKNIRKNSDCGGDDDIIVKIPRSSFEEMVKGNMDKDELLKKTAKKLVDFDNSVSTTKAGTGTEAGTSIGTGIGSGTGGSSSDNLNNAIDKVDLGRGDGSNFIPSLLDGNLSPLEILINCEILINLMILFHIVLLVLILIQKFNIKIVKNSSVGFISKIFNKYKLNKLQKFINKIGEMNNKYLSLLIIINVLIIVFYIFLNVYVNIELSSNLNEYIHVYNKFHFKKGGVLLLLLKSNINYKNTMLHLLFTSHKKMLSKKFKWDTNKYINRLGERM